MKPLQGGVMLGGKTALWHPWHDTPGQKHIPTRWEHGRILSPLGVLSHPQSVEECIQFVGRNQLYVFCNDILNAKEIAFSKELIEHESTEPFMQKTGKVVALRVHPSRTSGFFIPASTWLYATSPSSDFVEAVRCIYARFGYEAITPASLSEKVLRSTLPYRLFIHRPPAELRRILLENNGGGRIDLAEVGFFYPIAYSYDLNKAYLSFSRLVPDPYERPCRHVNPDPDWVWHYPAGFWHVTMTAHGSGIHPIYLDHTKTRKRKPYEGETFTKWLWNGEIADCISKGYTLEKVHSGYGFPKLSDFLCGWVDILWEALQKDDGELGQAIKKSMAVGLPGRFLKQPESYKLIPIGEGKKGDIPIASNWLDEGEPYLTDYYVRAEYNLESTALTPIGAYIVSECRRAIYHAQLEEAKRGNMAIRSYIDSVTFPAPALSLSVSTGLGDYKMVERTAYLAEDTRFVGRNSDTGEDEMKYPGQPVGSPARLALWRKYRQKQNEF